MWHGRAARTFLKTRLCRWRVAGARKNPPRQMRDAARRTGSPRLAVRATPAGPVLRTNSWQKTSIFVRCVRLQRWQVVAAGRLGVQRAVEPACGAGAGGAWRAARRRARAAVAPRRRPTRVALAHSLRSEHRGLRSWYRHQVHDGLRCLCDLSETAQYHLLCTFHSSYHRLIGHSLVHQLHPWWHVLLRKVNRFFKKSCKIVLFKYW